jgi:tetratricopeptide (TPR) repeat protein
MRTLRTELRWATIALVVVGSLAPALVRAEERDFTLRQKALKLNDIKGKDALLSEVLALLKDKASAKNLVAEAARLVAEKKTQPFAYNATLILGTVALEVKDYRAAETFYRLHLEQAKQLRSAQGLRAAYSGLITSAYNNRNYAEAEKLCKEVIKNEIIVATIKELSEIGGEDSEKELKTIEGFISEVLKDQILAIASQGDADRAIDMIDRLLKNPDSWPALDLKARAFRASGKYKEAAKAYEDEMERLKEDNDLKKKDKAELLDDVRYSLSSVYIDLGQVDKAAEQLKALLAKSPDNPTYNNDLGYVWADHDLNLGESEKLIRKALDEDRKLRQKDNPEVKPEEIKDRGAYLDSLGWVLYKQKKYAEAKKYLQEAVQNMIDEKEDESIEIYDHLGDVLMAVGEKAEALAAWKKGVAAAGDTKREQKRKEEVQKKIKSNE